MPRVHGIDLHRKHGRRRRPNNNATTGPGIDNNRSGGAVRLSSSTSSPALAPEYASAPLTTPLTTDKVRDEGNTPLEENYNSKSPLPENTSILTNTPSATSATNGKRLLLTTDTASSTSNIDFTPITTTTEIHPQSKELLDNLEFSSKSFSVATISQRAASSIALGVDAGVDAGMDAVMEDIAKNNSSSGVSGDNRVGHSMSSSIPVMENGNSTLEEIEVGRQRQNQHQNDDEVNTDILNNSANKLSSLSPSMSPSSSGDNNDDNSAGDNTNNNDDEDDDEDWDNLPLENMVNFLQRALRIRREGKEQGRIGTGGREHCTDIDTNGNNKNHGNSNDNNPNNIDSDDKSNKSRKSPHDLFSGGSDEGNATNSTNASDEKSVSVSHGEEGNKANSSIGNNNGKRSDGENMSRFSEENFIASQATMTAEKDDFGLKSKSDQPLDNATTKGKRNVVTPHGFKSKAALSVSPGDMENEASETPEHEDDMDDDSTPRHANISQPSEVQTQSTTPATERVALASSWKKPRSRHKKRMKNIEEKWKEARTNGHSNIALVDSTPVEHVKTSSTLESRPHERKDQSSGSFGGDENDMREAATQLNQYKTEHESTTKPAQNPHVAENSTVEHDVERVLDGVKAMRYSESSMRTNSERDSPAKWQKQRERIASPQIFKSCNVEKGSAENEGEAKISTDKKMHEDENNVEVQPSDIGITDEEKTRKSKQISTANPEIGLEKELHTLTALKVSDSPRSSSPSNRKSSRSRRKQKETPRKSEESNRLKEGTENKKDHSRFPKHSKKEKGYNHVDMTSCETAQATPPNRDIESEMEQKMAVRIHDPIDLTPEKDRNNIEEKEVIDLTNDETQQHNPVANANQESDDSEVWHDAKDELSMGHTQDMIDTNDSFLRTKSSTEQQNVHKSKSKTSTARIMFTGITPTTRHRRMIQSLGAELLESLEEASAATHLIATDGESIFRRTPKLMICICKTPNILSVEWLEKSSINQKLLDTDDFLLLDNESAEKAYNFSMRESIRNGILARKRGGLLGGWCVYICSGVAGNKAPSVKELTLIIEATGARVITSLNDSDMLEPQSIMILTSDPSTEAQKNEFGVRKMERLGAQIVTTTWLFQTIITQQSPNVRKSEISAVDTVTAAGSSNCNSNNKKSIARLSNTMSSDESSTKGEAGDLSCIGKRNGSGSMVFDLEYAASSLFLEKSLQSESRLCDDTPSRLPCRQFLSRDQFLSTYEKLPSFTTSSDSDKDEIASEMQSLWREYQDRYNDASPRKGKEDKNNFPPPSRRKTRSQKRQTSTSRPKSARGVCCRRGRKSTISTMVSPTSFVFDQPNEKPHGIPKDIILHNPFVTWEAYVLLKLRERANNIPEVTRSTTLEQVDPFRFFPRPISIMRLRNDEEGNNPDTHEYDSTRVALRIDADVAVELQTNPSANSKPKRQTQHSKRFKIFGTLQDVFDAHKLYQTSGMIPEQALALFALSAIDAVLTLHSCGVVHNNIGLDSFLVVKDLDNSRSSCFLQLIGFGDKSIILNCDKHVCRESHYDQDYFDLANVLHILLTGGIEVSLKTLPCGTVEFESKPFIKGNMFLRGALVWCDIIDALLGIGDIVHDGKKSEGPIQLNEVLKYASCESSADGASDRIKQIGWACHTFRGIASHDVFMSFLDGLNPHATSRACNSAFDCLSSRRTNSSYRQYGQLRPKIPTPNRTANQDLELQLMKQQSEIEIKSLALAKREAALKVQETNIEHEKQNLIRLESKYQSLFSREQAVQTKENALSKKEQNLIIEAKHLYRIQQEILKRDEQREKNLHHFDDTDSPASPHERYSEKSHTPNNLSPSLDTRPSLGSWSHRRLPTEQNNPTNRTTLAQNPHLNHDMSDVSDCSHSYDDIDSLSTNSPRYRGRKNLSAMKSRCHNQSYSQGSVEHTCSLQLLENRSVKAKTPTRLGQGNSSVTSSSKKVSKRRHHQNIENSSSAKGSRKRMKRESPESRIFKRTPKKGFLSLDDD